MVMYLAGYLSTFPLLAILFFIDKYQCIIINDKMRKLILMILSGFIFLNLIGNNLTVLHA